MGLNSGMDLSKPCCTENKAGLDQIPMSLCFLCMFDPENKGSIRMLKTTRPM